MQFCEECGSMMVAEDDRMVCTACGHTQPRDAEREADFITTETQTDDDVIESTPEAAEEGKPTTSDVVCDDCGNEEAYYTVKQTGGADEPPTRFFKCTECGHRWRDYD